MRVGVIVFPGTNCEQDVLYALRSVGAEAEPVWHRQAELAGLDGVVLPGGFAHGDYLRTGAIARFSPVMSGVARLAAEGRPVLGICNGFQILCEAGLLPGALLPNRSLRFICRPVHVTVASTDSVLTRTARLGQVLRLPLNSYQGNYVASPQALEEEGRVVLRYSTPAGELDPTANPNGSMAAIAGMANQAGNVVGLMPHPERAAEEVLGSVDGRVLLESFVTSRALVGV
jgi:phosphoribosylformylglycinamidine synthase I